MAMNVALLRHLVATRRNPSKSAYDYLHLADLRDAVAEAIGEGTGRWLDYGTIISPYEPLISGATRETADLLSEAPPDIRPTYEFLSGNECPAPSGRFDGVLSTQVLEHVAEPEKYLRDAARMLKEGGTLVLSTHGIWEDHPSPDDFHRWTAQGLRRLIEGSGFEVLQVVPVTCGFRAITTLALAHLRPLPWKSDDLRFRLKMWALGKISYFINSIATVLFRDDRMGREGDLATSSRFYVALLVVARKRI